MPTSVAEYLGQRTDVESPIHYVPPSETPTCPFMNAPCSKVVKGYKPVCSVRRTDGTAWIVCPDRLCATRKSLSLNDYQRNILLEVAHVVFGTHLRPEQIIVKREVPMPTGTGTSYSADYVMMLHGARRQGDGPERVVLEMQGGGETSNTGKLTELVDIWEQSDNKSNYDLARPVSGVGLIVTNAWRRQQEQFLVKGNIADNTGGGLVFCVGSLLFDVLKGKVDKANLQDLKDHNWTLAIIGLSEDKSSAPEPGPIHYKIDTNRLLFTNFHSFVRALTDQGIPDPNIFRGTFVTLSGDSVMISDQGQQHLL